MRRPEDVHAYCFFLALWLTTTCLDYITWKSKCTCTWLYHVLKLLPSTVFCHVLIQVSDDGFMFRLIYMFFGCDVPIQLLLKSLSSVFTIYQYVTFYALANRLTRFCTCILPIQLLLCVSIIVNKCLTASIIKYYVSEQ